MNEQIPAPLPKSDFKFFPTELPAEEAMHELACFCFITIVFSAVDKSLISKVLFLCLSVFTTITSQQSRFVWVCSHVYFIILH